MDKFFQLMSRQGLFVSSAFEFSHVTFPASFQDPTLYGNFRLVWAENQLAGFFASLNWRAL
jgi:hypothetical protein